MAETWLLEIGFWLLCRIPLMLWRKEIQFLSRRLWRLKNVRMIRWKSYGKLKKHVHSCSRSYKGILSLVKDTCCLSSLLFLSLKNSSCCWQLFVIIFIFFFPSNLVGWVPIYLFKNEALSKVYWVSLTYWYKYFHMSKNCIAFFFSFSCMFQNLAPPFDPFLSWIFFFEFKFWGEGLQFRGGESCATAKNIECFSKEQPPWFCEAVFRGNLSFIHLATV